MVRHYSAAPASVIILSECVCSVMVHGAYYYDPAERGSVVGYEFGGVPSQSIGECKLYSFFPNQMENFANDQNSIFSMQ